MSGPYSPPPGGAPGPGGAGQYPPAGGPQWPGAAPGPQGHPGQPPHGGGPQWQAPAPAEPRSPADMGKNLALGIAGLALLNFIWGFLPASSSDYGSIAVFSSPATASIVILLAAGLLALGPMLPGGRSYAYPVAAASVAGALVQLFVLIMTTGGKGVGMILLLIFGLLQAAAAVFAWLIGAGMVKPSAPAGHQGQASWGYPAAGAAGQPHPGQQHGGQGYPGQPGPARPAQTGQPAGPPSGGYGGGVPPASPPSGPMPPAQ